MFLGNSLRSPGYPRQFALLLLAALVSLIVPMFSVRAAPPQQAVPQGQLVFKGPDSIEPRDGSDELFVLTLGTGELRQITDTPQHIELYPDWSPDGTRIAFARAPQTNQTAFDIYTIRPDGSELSAPLTTNPGQDRDPSWVAAGIAFDSIATDSVNDTFEIYLMDANGQNRRNLTISRFDDSHPAWSPDGRRVAFSRKLPGPGQDTQRDLMVLDVSTPGAEPINLSRSLDSDECFANWSPDSTLIAYHQGGIGTCGGERPNTPDIYVVAADGGSPPRQLTSGPADDLSPEWSPDQQFIAFVSDRANIGGSRDIYVMRADGSNIQRVTTTPGSESSPSWRPQPQAPEPPPPPAGDGLLVYQGTGPSGEPDLFTLPVTGGTPTNITNTPGQRERHPDWSPDGSQIAFQRNPITDEAASDIFSMRADGTGQPTQLTSHPGQDRDPSWVAAGIAFDTLRSAVSPTYEIFTIGATGGNERNLSNSPQSDNHPAWSPDGSRVAFQRRLPRTGGGAQWDIVLITVSSGSLTNLSNSADSDECMPAWSPDGTQLAFYKGAPGACDTGGTSTVPSDIYRVRADGSGQAVQLTSNSGRNIDPAWSPDGAQLAFAGNVDGDYEIYVLQADGTARRQLTSNGTPDLAPDWQPQGVSPAPQPTLDKRVYLPVIRR